MRVLVVDDSAFQRVTLAAAFREVPGVHEVESAPSGEEAIRRVLSTPFDLVALDVEMPSMNGLAVLRWLMANHPLPVVIVSELRHERTAVLALEIGAFDVLRKPSARKAGSRPFQELLAEVVEEAAELRMDLLSRRAFPESPTEARGKPVSGRPAPVSNAATPPAGGTAVLVVASSTGGPPALRDLFGSVAPREVVVGVAQHMPAPFTRSLASRLSSSTGWPAREAVDRASARAGIIWVAPGGHHLEFERSGRGLLTRLRPATEGLRWCPSADLLFRSASRTFGAEAIAVVLTGMGDDGSEGARAIAASGGHLVCESRDTAVVPGMPDSAARAVPGARRLPLQAIGGEVARWLDERG